MERGPSTRNYLQGNKHDSAMDSLSFMVLSPSVCSALEKRRGAVLLRRDTHRMTLTEAGRRMLGDARAMLAFAEEAEQRVRNDQTELRGHLGLLATVDFGQFPFTRLIASFMQRHRTSLLN